LNNFRIFETRQFVQDLAKEFVHSEKTRIRLHISVYPQLRQNPYFGRNIKKLNNYRPDTWRYRISDFRFFYEVDDRKKIIFMITADNRKDAYR